MHDTTTALAEAFLSAPLEAEGWDKALKALANRTRSSRANLVEVSYGAFVFNWVTDIPPGFHEGLEAIGGGSPDVNWRVASTGAPMKIASERDYAETRRRLKTTIYDDYSEAVDSPFGCQTVLDQSPWSFHGLAMLRSRRDGETTEADRAVFAAAAPHALAGIRLQQAIDRQGASLVAGALDAMTAAAFICDAYGRVMAMTVPAEQMLEARSGLRLHDRRLRAVRSTDDRNLQQQLRAVLDFPQRTSATRLWMAGEGGPSTGQICELFALPRREWAFGFAPRAMVVVRTVRSVNDIHRSLLRDAFDLTRAESEVASMTAEGMSREQIAGRRGASPSTVQSQLKSIFGKAGVNREAELVALLNKLFR